MTRRRFFFAALFPAALFAQPDTPHNRVARAANAFNTSFVKWAEAFNRTTKGNVDAGEMTAYEPMPKQFRKIEHERMRWIRGR